MPRLTSSPPLDLGGARIVEHELEAPLDHDRPDGPAITVFAREVAALDGLDRPFLVFFQGGPGFESPRPHRRPAGPGWVERAVRDFRVLLLDQRGTGRSTPVGALPGMTPEEQAAHLQHFRADAIVRDAEALREALGVERWSVLGQSFGGFCVMHYLSRYPDALREAVITGGVPPLGEDRIDELYRRTYAKAIERSRRYFERYPADRDRLLALRRWVEAEDVRLPSGDRLTARTLRAGGSRLGTSDGAESLHHVLELPAGSPAFLHDVQDPLGVARNPIYAVLHEASWADGGRTRWAADRLLPDEYAEDPALFTGEHVLRWMFEEIGALTPLRAAADLLAERSWPRLYDPAVLASNEVPVAAAVYADDLYVERGFSEETAAEVRGMRVWLTNEYEHNGLRADGDRVLGRLLDLVRQRV